MLSAVVWRKVVLHPADSAPSGISMPPGLARSRQAAGSQEYAPAFWIAGSSALKFSGSVLPSDAADAGLKPPRDTLLPAKADGSSMLYEPSPASASRISSCPGIPAAMTICSCPPHVISLAGQALPPCGASVSASTLRMTLSSPGCGSGAGLLQEPIAVPAAIRTVIIPVYRILLAILN